MRSSLYVLFMMIGFAIGYSIVYGYAEEEPGFYEFKDGGE